MLLPMKLAFFMFIFFNNVPEASFVNSEQTRIENGNYVRENKWGVAEDFESRAEVKKEDITETFDNNKKAYIRPKRDIMEDTNQKLTDIHSFVSQITVMEENQNDLIKNLHTRIVNQNAMIQALANQVNDISSKTGMLQNTLDATVIRSQKYEQKRANQLDESLSTPATRNQVVQLMTDVNQIAYFFATTMVKKEKIPYIPSCSVENSNETKNNIVSCLRPRIVDLYNQLTIPVRIVDGHTPHEGRVEVFFNGEFSTICDHSWDDRDAQVVCRMLGYSGGQKLDVNSVGFYFMKGTGTIHLSNMMCIGDEDNILRCPYSKPAWDCDHSYDAGVKCDFSESFSVTN